MTSLDILNKNLFNTSIFFKSITIIYFQNHVKISKKQLAEFFKLTTHSGKGSSDVDVPLLHTFRPVQPLNGRMIYYADLKLRCKHRDWTKTRTSMCDIYYKYVSIKKLNLKLLILYIVHVTLHIFQFVLFRTG